MKKQGKCEGCGSEDLKVNGLCYVCGRCGNIGDSTFIMIASRVKREHP